MMAFDALVFLRMFSTVKACGECESRTLLF